MDPRSPDRLFGALLGHPYGASATDAVTLEITDAGTLPSSVTGGLDRTVGDLLKRVDGCCPR